MFFKNLRTLDCRFNRMALIPPEIGKLTMLVKLFLRFNKLTELPATIGGLSNLEVAPASTISCVCVCGVIFLQSALLQGSFCSQQSANCYSCVHQRASEVGNA